MDQHVSAIFLALSLLGKSPSSGGMKCKDLAVAYLPSLYVISRATWICVPYVFSILASNFPLHKSLKDDRDQ